LKFILNFYKTLIIIEKKIFLNKDTRLPFFQQLKTICSIARNVILLLTSRFEKITPEFFLISYTPLFSALVAYSGTATALLFFNAALLHT